jgi:hypothetical protein
LIRGAVQTYLDRDYVVRSFLFQRTIEHLMETHSANAFTIECFEFCASRLPEKWKITPCLIHTLFKDRGMASSCEGDLGALLGMRLLMSLAGKSSHLGNMFFREGKILEINHSAPGINGEWGTENCGVSGENRHQDTLSPILRPGLTALLMAAMPCVQLVKAYPAADFPDCPSKNILAECRSRGSRGSWNLLHFVREPLFCTPQVVRLLHSEPQAWSISAKLSEAHGHLRRHTRTASQNTVQRLPRNPQMACSLTDREFQCRQHVFLEQRARMCRFPTGPDCYSVFTPHKVLSFSGIAPGPRDMHRRLSTRS